MATCAPMLDGGAAAAAVGASVRSLREAAGRLEALFCGAGGRLAELHARALDIASRSTAEAERLGGDELRAARDEMLDLLDRLDRYAATSGEQIERAERRLGELLEALDAATSRIPQFERLVQMLRILGISTKIESSRLSRSDIGFDTLSKNVEALAMRIRAKTDDLASLGGGLAARARASAARARDLRSARCGRFAAAIAETRASADLLASSCARGARAAAAAAETTSQVAAAVGDIVTSMQFHDITRQELEHVREAVAELSFADEGAGRVCALQAAQLGNSRGRLAAAVASARESFGGIGRRLTLLAGTTGERDAGAGAGSLERLDRSLVPVADELAADEASYGALAEVTDAVASAAEDMSRLAAEIESIGAEVGRIALNASVKAAHTGAEGAALGVLAEEIQRLATDTRRRTGELAAPLRGVAAAAAEIRRDVKGAESSGAHGSGKGLGDEMRRLAANLSAFAGRGAAAGIERDARSLASELDAVAAGFAGHAAVDGELADVERALRGAAEACGASELDADDLAHLAARYTTGAERRVHEELIGGVAGAPGEAAGEFGDNVELF
ncbi:hypothetical protein LLG88_00715 [bacterium]|nr:hypothetical protein [bacterium]